MTQLKPAVVITDLLLRDLHGLEVTRQLHQALPATRIIIFSLHAEAAYQEAAFNNGAAAYIRKDAPLGELFRAIRNASPSTDSD